MKTSLPEIKWRPLAPGEHAVGHVLIESEMEGFYYGRTRMPSKSAKMARTMAGAAHNKAFARKMGIPQNVAKEFNQADKGTKRLSKAMKGKRNK